MHIAANNGHVKLVQYLISKGADVNAMDKWDKTPLEIAVDSKRDEVAKILKGSPTYCDF